MQRFPLYSGRIFHSPFLVGCGLSLIWLCAACGGDDREARFQAAAQQLSEARLEVESARAVVDEKQARVAALQPELDAALAVLRRAEERMAAAEAAVDLDATDEILFRAVQKRLLEAEDLEKVAIAARVEQGVVYLSGRVPDADLRNRAIDVARETPGIARVESRIDLESEPEVSAPAEK